MNPNPIPTSSKNSATDKALTDSIDLCFEQVKTALNQQQECNLWFDARIGSLENTMKSIDNKIDFLLTRMEYNYPTTNKLPHTSSPAADSSFPPGQLSQIQIHQAHHHQV